MFEIGGVSSPHFLFFQFKASSRPVLYIADSVDSVWVAKLFLGLDGLCGAQGSYLSACPPTGLIQEPKFMAMKIVVTTRWMSLTTVFQLQCSPQDKKPQGGLCSNCNLTWGNCCYCLSLRQLWAMKLDASMCGSLPVDGWIAESKTEDNVYNVCFLLSRGPFTLLYCCQYPAM